MYPFDSPEPEPVTFDREFFKKPAGERQKIEEAITRKVGEKEVVSRLRKLHIATKDSDPITSGSAKSDGINIAGTFIGKRKVISQKRMTKKKKYWK